MTATTTQENETRMNIEREYIQGPLCRLGNFYSFLEQGRGHGVWTECLEERLEDRYMVMFHTLYHRRGWE